MDISFFAIAIPVASAVLGYLVGFWMQKWKAMEARRTDIERLRRPIYAEALEIIYAIENNRGNAESLGAGIDRLRDWYPTKVSYLPPKGNDAIFAVITDATVYYIDLNNRETAALSRSRDIFNRSLQTAKLFLMNSEDIRWLQEDPE